MRYPAGPGQRVTTQQQLAASAPPSAVFAYTVRWKPLPKFAVAAKGLGELRAAVEARRPAIVVDLAHDWPALTHWQPPALINRFGDRMVRVYDASFGQPGPGYMGSDKQVPFREFLDAVLTDRRDLRMFLHNLASAMPELVEDIRFPQVGLRFSRAFVFSFLGCRGSTTPLHFDIDMGYVLHTAVTGRRRIRLFSPADSVALYRHPCTVRSYVDFDSLDVHRFPAATRVEGFEVILEPGQTILMPPGWWHEFHYLDAGMGVSLRASSFGTFDRLRALRNLLLSSLLDRAANRLAPDRWFRWKSARAEESARRWLASVEAE